MALLPFDVVKTVAEVLFLDDPPEPPPNTGPSIPPIAYPEDEELLLLAATERPACASVATPEAISEMARFCERVCVSLSACVICSVVVALLRRVQSTTAIFVLSPGASGRL
jgi:hypothetical protein